jgi:hypothetical protein
VRACVVLYDPETLEPGLEPFFRWSRGFRAVSPAFDPADEQAGAEALAAAVRTDVLRSEREAARQAMIAQRAADPGSDDDVPF